MNKKEKIIRQKNVVVASKKQSVEKSKKKTLRHKNKWVNLRRKSMPRSRHGTVGADDVNL
jgi:hypothetical protein